MKRLVLAKKYKLLVETLFLPLFLIISFFKSRRLLRRFGKFDVFIADQGGYPGSWSTNIALKASHSLGIKKRVLLVHHQAVPRRIFMNTIESIFDRRVAFWSTSIITVSNATRDSLVNRRDFNLMRKPITVIYNGLDEKSELVKNRFRSLFGISLDRRVALVLGRGEVYKGHEELLRSIALLPIEIKKDFLLVIVGKVDTARREYLTDLAKRLGVLELIMFCGFVDLDSSEIIVDVDLLVCVTQDFEGFGYTVLEAMSVGTPVIATSVGAIPEFFDERYGIVIRPGSIQAISDAIELGLSDPISIAHRVSSAKVHSKRFSGERMATEIYRELKY